MSEKWNEKLTGAAVGRQRKTRELATFSALEAKTKQASRLRFCGRRVIGQVLHDQRDELQRKTTQRSGQRVTNSTAHTKLQQKTSKTQQNTAVYPYFSEKGELDGVVVCLFSAFAPCAAFGRECLGAADAVLRLVFIRDDATSCQRLGEKNSDFVN